MQTLNVGAGRTDEEYKAAEEQRRADLRTESRSIANYFFVAAGLAAFGAGLLPVRVNVFISIGLVDLLGRYGGTPALGYVTAATWVLVLVGLGLAAQKGYRWAFLVGMVLYVADMIPLCVMFSMWSLGVHAFFVYKWYQGQKALQDLEA